MPGDAEEGTEVEMLPLVLSLATCGGAGCCLRPPLPWRWGRPGTIAGLWAAGGSGGIPGDAEEGTEVKMLPLVLSLRKGEVREVCCVVASIILTMGRGEATMGEKVDPRRAQAGPEWERERELYLQQ